VRGNWELVTKTREREGTGSVTAGRQANLNAPGGREGLEVNGLLPDLTIQSVRSGQVRSGLVWSGLAWFWTGTVEFVESE
jgi:hypothetical protein